jgi:ABC-type Fe3+ transport system substrate-binding protein
VHVLCIIILRTVSAAELEGLTYEDLAKPEWNGRVVIRKSSNMYNQSLVASLVANHGVEATEAWANGLFLIWLENQKVMIEHKLWL